MPRRKVETPEEREKSKRAFDFKQILLEANSLPEPTYKFKIGEQVEIGNLKDVIVVDVLLDGKGYEIDYSSEYRSPSGEMLTSHHNRMFVTWLRIRPVSTNKDHQLIQNEDLQISFSNTSIEGLFSKVYYFGTEMNPEYQRDYVWSQDDNVSLIDSVFRNIEIGKFVFIHRDYTEEILYEILDGKQRLNALSLYYENKFSYKGLRYNDLSKREKNHFLNYRVSVGELERATKQQILRYFFILNRSGKSMDAKHLSRIEQMIKGEILP